MWLDTRSPPSLSLFSNSFIARDLFKIKNMSFSLYVIHKTGTDSGCTGCPLRYTNPHKRLPDYVTPERKSTEGRSTTNERRRAWIHRANDQNRGYTRKTLQNRPIRGQKTPVGENLNMYFCEMFSFSDVERREVDDRSTDGRTECIRSYPYDKKRTTLPAVWGTLGQGITEDLQNCYACLYFWGSTWFFSGLTHVIFCSKMPNSTGIALDCFFSYTGYFNKNCARGAGLEKAFDSSFFRSASGLTFRRSKTEQRFGGADLKGSGSSRGTHRRVSHGRDEDYYLTETIRHCFCLTSRCKLSTEDSIILARETYWCGGLREWVSFLQKTGSAFGVRCTEIAGNAVLQTNQPP